MIIKIKVQTVIGNGTYQQQNIQIKILLVGQSHLILGGEKVIYIYRVSRRTNCAGRSRAQTLSRAVMSSKRLRIAWPILQHCNRASRSDKRIGTEGSGTASTSEHVHSDYISFSFNYFILFLFSLGRSTHSSQHRKKKH